MYAAVAAAAQRWAPAAVGMAQLIDSTFAVPPVAEVPDTVADRSLASALGVVPSARAASARTTPDVAICCSVTIFGE